MDDVASTLNQLIQTCKDGENGFRVAAESVDDVNLQHLLESYSQQRSEFAAELESEVKRLDQNPAEAGTWQPRCIGDGWTSNPLLQGGTKLRSLPSASGVRMLRSRRMSKCWRQGFRPIFGPWWSGNFSKSKRLTIRSAHWSRSTPAIARPAAESLI